MVYWFTTSPKHALPLGMTVRVTFTYSPSVYHVFFVGNKYIVIAHKFRSGQLWIVVDLIVCNCELERRVG